MNLVLEDGEEVDTKNNTRVKIGKFFDLIENIMQKERASAKNAVVK
jgi:intein/homing endonuclease